jgi:limonene-1,2-epoxide hydrolase
VRAESQPAAAASDAANVTIVRRFLDDVVNGGKIELLDGLWSHDLVWHGGSLGEVHGIDAFRKMLAQAVTGAFTGMKLTVHDIVASK